MPANFLGNATVGALVTLPIDQLCDPSDDEDGAILSQIAQKIQNAISDVTTTSVRQQISVLNKQPTCDTLALDIDTWPGQDMLITELTRFHLHDLHWGPELGQTVSLRLAKATLNQGHGCISSRMREEHGGGFEVYLHLEECVIQRLKDDRVFRKFFTFLC